ncbi:response regulator [Sulfurimonas aquatica]|uniref:Response regulator n=1 Tax=Sulfurimonas aquatica TaxID=2672570 RepID=A0A975AY78_9BACT|nr:response regulator transcription factor [Sulfurimonas aquatica]QSZ40665.1 response regulator [Sulfurimonas aquatica]
MRRILYLEDDPKLAQIVVEYLSRFYQVDHLSHLEDLNRRVEHFNYDVAIIDRNLHGEDIGLKAIEIIHKKDATTGVIVTSSYSSVDDKIDGLSLGADDYLEKPFNIRELEARIAVLLRRKLPTNIELNGMKFDTESRQIEYDGKVILLSQKENEILFYLLENANKVFSAQDLIYAIYSHPDDILPNTITVTVGKIRKKLPVEIIKTFKTRGYMIEVR